MQLVVRLRPTARTAEDRSSMKPEPGSSVVKNRSIAFTVARQASVGPLARTAAPRTGWTGRTGVSTLTTGAGRRNTP